MILTRDGKEITTIYKQDGYEIEDLKDANGRLIYLATRKITGAPPLYFSGRGKPLTDYLISGNTVQDGTPAPEAPVDVVGCGTRTRNLFDINGETDFISDTYIAVVDNGLKFENVPSGNGARIYYSAQYPAGTYHISCAASGYNYYAARLFSDSPFTGATYNTWFGGYYRDFQIDGISAILTFDNDFKIGFIANAQGGATFTIYDIMLSKTEADFEPYGFKLPLAVNATEYPIYLGQVETTRRVKKLVLMGEENWEIRVEGTNNAFFMLQSGDSAINHQIKASHYLQVTIGTTNTANGVDVTPLGHIRFRPINVSSMSVSDFKDFLAQQYAAGTPVTVWYVLANETTGIVNEPLHKIGDYADTISYAQAGVTIPTVSGANILDMTSTIKPSEVYIKGKGIKPTGYGKLTDKNSVYILDKNGVQIAVHGQ